MPGESIVHLVDDDDAARESLRFLLESAGLPAHCHDSARAFLETAPAGQFGCAITDVRMPHIDGIELLRRLRAHKIDWPVILVSGHLDVPVAVEAMKNGAADFIEKPYDAEVMLSAVRAALASQEQGALVAGRPHKAIAHGLGLSERAGELHRADIMTKMQSRSLSELVRMSLIVNDS